MNYTELPLWQEFKEQVKADGDTIYEVLSHFIEQYVNEGRNNA